LVIVLLLINLHIVSLYRAIVNVTNQFFGGFLVGVKVRARVAV